MFKKLTNGCVSLVQKYLPDPFIFCIILTVLVFVLGMPLTGQSFVEMTVHWGEGVWSLLSFSMQMALVLVLGSALANSPPMQRLLKRLASIPKTPVQAIVFVTIVGVIACWINWGFGLVVGAIFAKEIAKQVKKVDYRLLIASAYSTFLIWHGGISGSIPLTIATYSDEVYAQTAGVITESISTMQTIFSPFNLIICVGILIIMPFINAKMHPDAANVISIDASMLGDVEIVKTTPKTPAEKLENSRIMSALIIIIGVVYIVHYFWANGFNLDLNIVNMIFLILGITFYGNPISYVHAIGESTKESAGILLQFPFYAGIMGMMTGANPETGSTLAGVISNGFVAISTRTTFPLFSFLSAGIVNFFIPSGGGQWAVQAPIMMPAGAALGVDPAITAMSIAWGDAWTNLLQPFWALPALGIAGLGARDIMGYCLINLLWSGVWICLVFLGVGLIF